MYVFGSVARTLGYILSRLFYLSVAQYVDDYPQLEPAASAPSADRLTIDVFGLLGWELKMIEGKVPGFGIVFSALDVVFDLSRRTSSWRATSRSASSRSSAG